jgi:hypothetical protein
MDVLSIVMVGLGPIIHEFLSASVTLPQANSWMPVPSTGMTSVLEVITPDE